MKDNQFFYKNKIYELLEFDYKNAGDHVQSIVEEACNRCSFKVSCGNINIETIAPEHLRCNDKLSYYYREVLMVEFMLEEILS